jgi:hypothetical protein
VSEAKPAQCADCCFWLAQEGAARGDCAKEMLTYPWYYQVCPEGRTSIEAPPAPAMQSQVRGVWGPYITGVKP